MLIRLYHPLQSLSVAFFPITAKLSMQKLCLIQVCPIPNRVLVPVKVSLRRCLPGHETVLLTFKPCNLPLQVNLKQPPGKYPLKLNSTYRRRGI